MQVEAIKQHQFYGKRRNLGDKYEIRGNSDLGVAKALGFVKVIGIGQTSAAIVGEVKQKQVVVGVDYGNKDGTVGLSEIVLDTAHVIDVPIGHDDPAGKEGEEGVPGIIDSEESKDSQGIADKQLIAENPAHKGRGRGKYKRRDMNAQ